MPSGSIWDEASRMNGNHKQLRKRVDELEAHMMALDQRIKSLENPPPKPKRKAAVKK